MCPDDNCKGHGSWSGQFAAALGDPAAAARPPSQRDSRSPSRSPSTATASPRTPSPPWAQRKTMPRQPLMRPRMSLLIGLGRVLAGELDRASQTSASVDDYFSASPPLASSFFASAIVSRPKHAPPRRPSTTRGRDGSGGEFGLP